MATTILKSQADIIARKMSKQDRFAVRGVSRRGKGYMTQLSTCLYVAAAADARDNCEDIEMALDLVDKLIAESRWRSIDGKQFNELGRYCLIMFESGIIEPGSDCV